MKSTNIILIIAMIFVTSCASYNPGSYAKISGGEHPKNLPINAKVYNQLSHGPFTYVNFTFGNMGNEGWRRVKKVRILDIGGIEGARLVLGPDLNFWSEGMRRKTSIDAHNTAILMATLTTGLAVGAAASGYKGNYQLSTQLFGAAATFTTIQAFNQAFDEADALEIANLVPPSHIYRPFSIPPRLYLARWALFETPNGQRPKYVEFEVQYLSGKTGKYKVSL